MTPDDVIFSFDVFKQNSPQLSAYYRHVKKAEQTGEREITFTFTGPGNRELPQIVGELPVLPKHWWQGTDKSGNKRDVAATTLEPPLGSGPYRVKDFAPGRTIAYEKVADYWGKDLNLNIGSNNFQQVRYEYFRDSTVALEAFKGDQVDWRTENSAKDWATAYDFPALRDKKVLKEEFPVRSTGMMQAFAFNIRRDKFKDPRVRRAFNFAFDFEEMNRQIFFGQYKRVASYFEGTELACSGLPQGLELEILQAVKDKVPADLFTKPYTNPVSGNAQAVRNNLREALKLLREAGYEVRNTKLTNAKSGETMKVELLVQQPAFERVMLFYKPSLERIGITVSVRTIDTSQYENRLRQWDFDIIIASWAELLSPGNEQRAYWSSQTADVPGSRNLVGIKNPAVDAMIERVVFAKSREELVAATHALDRVLLWNDYVVPQWTYGKQRTARWDRFSHPETMPTLRAGGVSQYLVVGRGEGGQGAAKVLITRRHVLVLSASAIAAAKFASPAASADAAERHGMSAFGDLVYPADFPHFAYVNPDAPKGGAYSEAVASRGYNGSFLTFDSLNAYILKGTGAYGMDSTFATLMVRSGDEPDAMYGLAAKSVAISDNGLTYRFTLRGEAKFHDGTPLTAHDVAWSLNTLKDKGHPIISQSLRDFKGAEAMDDHAVVVRFAEKRARDVPLLVASLPIFSKAYYAKQPFDQSTLEIPLGSGPYKVGRLDVGHFIEYERVKDWWGADLPVARGANNFDTVRYEYYRDREVGFVGFTAKNYLFREEFTSRTWATRYDFPAFQGRPRQARADTGRHVVGRARLVHQHPAREIQGPPFARSADRRLRFRIHQQEHHVWRVPAHGVAVPEFAVDGDRQAGCGGAQAARTVPRQGAGRGVRRAVCAAGEQRQRPRSALAAPRLAIAHRGGLCRRQRPAGAAERPADHDRISRRRAGPEAASSRLHQESRHARHRGHVAPGRSRAISPARRRLRFRHHRRPGDFRLDAGRFAAHLFVVAGGIAQRLAESRRHRRSGDRRDDRRDHRRRHARGLDRCLPRARPRVPRRPLLGPALVSAGAPHRLLGRVRLACDKTALFPGYPGDLVV